MKNDKLLAASILGALSTIPSEILTRILLYLGMGKYSIYQLASMIITINRPITSIGLIIDCIVGGCIAVSLYLVLIKIQTNYLVIKVTLSSLVFWLICEIVFTTTIEGKFISIRPISDYYSNLLGAVTFGITLGLLFKKFIFRK